LSYSCVFRRLYESQVNIMYVYIYIYIYIYITLAKIENHCDSVLLSA